MPTPRGNAWHAVARVALAATLALATTAPSAAEEAAATPPAIELIRLQVRAGHEAEIERFLASLVEAAERTGASIRWRAHRRVDGERPLYVLVLRAESAAELDAWSGLTPSEALERAHGPEQAQRLLALREAALESMQRERFVPLPALSLGD